MPYIKPDQRKRIDQAVDNLTSRIRATAQQDDCVPDGMLNYAMTKLLLGTICKKMNYASAERAIGCLECCKLEMYRKLAGPYEDRKAKTNGEVYL